MKKKSLKLKLLYGVLLPVMVVCIALCTVFAITSNLSARALPGGNSITLYKNGKFSREGFDQLAVKLLGEGNTADDMNGETLLEHKGGFATVGNVKKSYELLGVEQTNTAANKEWTVTIEDMEFMPVFLSVETHGDIVLTLWQANGYGQSVFNESYSQATSLEQRSNVYGTSYIRTVALNNGGTYYTGYGNSKDASAASLKKHTATPSYDNPYMLFTSDETFSKYLVTPDQMRFVIEKENGNGDYVNDNTNYTPGYTDAEDYRAWTQDKVWLPSISEIKNIWQTTVNQNRSGGDSWLRSATTVASPDSGEYNNNLAYAYRLTSSGAGMQDYVNSEHSIRAAINLNLTASLYKVKSTTGYSKTDTNPGRIAAFDAAWKYAIDKSLVYYSIQSAPENKWFSDSSGSVAYVTFDRSRRAVVFQMYADWGAYKGAKDKYACFNGGLATVDATTVEDKYYYHGALYIAQNVNLVIDLNGHTINRNLYDPNRLGNYAINPANNVSFYGAGIPDGTEIADCPLTEDYVYYYGNVIQIGIDSYASYGNIQTPGGTLTVTDSSVKDELAVNVNEEGVTGTGRITGGKHNYIIKSHFQHHMGGGVRVLSKLETDSTDIYAEKGNLYRGRFILEQGAICYNDAPTGGGVGCPGSYQNGKAFKMTGGTISHNYGGAFRACWYTGYDEFLGGSMQYNTARAAIQYEGGASEPVFDGVEISHNSEGVILLTNVTATSLTFNDCIINYNSASKSNIIFDMGGDGWNTSSASAGCTFNNCEFIGNTAARGGLIDLSLPWYDSSKYNHCPPDEDGDMPVEHTYISLWLNIDGGTFANNTSEGKGGLVYMSKGTLNIKGNPVIRNNSSVGGGGVIYMKSGVCSILGGRFINNTTSGNGGGIYMGGGTLNMTGGTFTNNTASVDGGGVYMTNGEFVMSGGTFSGNSASGTGGGVYMANGKMYLEEGQGKIQFINNEAREYPGFYCKSLTMCGNVEIADNRTSDLGLEHNIYLADPEATINISGALEGNIGITKSVDSGATTIAKAASVPFYVYPMGDIGVRYNRYQDAQGNNYYERNGVYYQDINRVMTAVSVEASTLVPCDYYKITTDDLLKMNCDAGENYLFTVELDANNNTLVKLSEKQQHKHSWVKHELAPTCTEHGYIAYVCTGCKEIYDGSEEHKTNTSSASTKPWEVEQTTTGKGVIQYIAPKGHPYGYMESGNFLSCNVCGYEIYFEGDDVPDQTYNTEAHTPAVTYRIYELVDGNKVYIPVARIEDAPTATYSDNVNGGTATVALSFATAQTKLVTNGTYIVPFGKNEGRPAKNADGEVLTYSYKSVLWKEYYKNFRINKAEVSVRLENWQKENLYIGDSISYFNGISYFATIDGGNIDVAAYGKSTLMWKTSANGTYSENYPVLKVSEKGADGKLIPVTYYWKWVPNDANSLTPVEGTISVVAKDYTLNGLTVNERNASVIYDEYDINTQVKKMFTVTAEMLGEKAFNRVLLPDEYKLYLYDPDTKEEYDYLISGTYKLIFKYTYSGVEKEAITDSFYNVLTAYNRIEAQLDGRLVYDSMTDIDGLRDYLTVKGFKHGDNTGKEIDGYYLEAEGKAWGSGSGEYTVNVCYGNKTAVKKVPVTVTVHTNAVDRIEATWLQAKPCNPSTNLTDLSDYGELRVTVYYLDGTHKDIPLIVNGQSGYALSGKISQPGTNKVTITYSEANALSGGLVTSASDSIEVVTESRAIKDLSYEPNGIVLTSDTTVNDLERTLLVNVIYNDGSIARADRFTVPYCYYDEATSELVFAISATKGGATFEKQINHALPDEVTGITATVVDEVKTNGLTLYDSLDHVKEAYIALTVNKSNNRPINYAAGKLPKNVTLSLPASQNGKFVIGDNTITVSYNLDGAVYTDKVVINFREIELTDLEVRVKPGYGSGAVDAGHIFTSSTLDDVRSMISVTGKYGDGTTAVDVHNYKISGSLAEGAQQWSIRVENKEGAGQTSFNTDITVNVSAVAMDGISAEYKQPDDIIIHQATPIDEIAKYVTVTAHYNDGSEATIHTGYEVKLNDNGTFNVKYNEIYECNTTEAIEYSEAVFERIEVVSMQGNNVLYASVGEDDAEIGDYYLAVAECLSVRKYFIDGRYAEIPYDNTGASGYTLSGSFKNGAKMYVNYKDADVEFTQEITCLDVMPLLINQLVVANTTINNYYLSYGLEGLKSHVTVTATYNDERVRVLNKDEYTLSGELIAGQACTITVSAGEQEATFTVTPVNGNVLSINRIERAQTDSDVIYSSAELDSLKQYLRVYVNVDAGETPVVINSQDYSLIGSINIDGSYSIQVLINGEGMVPYTIPDRLLKITPLQPADNGLTVENSATSVVSGMKFKDFAKYLKVNVRYNDGKTAALAYDDTGANGYTLSGMLVAFEDKAECNVTVSYTLNAKTVEVEVPVSVVPLTSSLDVELADNLPDIYYSNVFTGNGVNAASLAKVIDGYLKVYLVSNGGASKTEITNADYTFTSAVYNQAEGTATITVSTDLPDVTNKTATFTVPVITVKPVGLQVEQKGGSVIYTTATNEQIKNALTVNVELNDGSTKEVTATDYILSVKSGSVAIGGRVEFTVSYYDAANKATIKEDVEIIITEVEVSYILTQHIGNTLYTISPESAVRAAIQVDAYYNNGDYKENVTDYEIICYDMYGQKKDKVVLEKGDNFLEIKYKGLTADCYISGVQDPIGDGTVSDISVNLIENPKTIYTSNNLEDIRNNITVTAKHVDGYDICEVDCYTLELYDEINANKAAWGAGNFYVQVTYNDGMTATRITKSFAQTIVDYELKTAELILDQTNFPIYSDYELENIKEGIQDNLKVSATWTDGYNHANEYTLTVTPENITKTDEINVLKIKYTYLRAGETGSREALVNIALTPVNVKDIKVTPKAEYTLYTSDAVSSIAEAATLTLIKNSGAEESVSWDSYIVSFVSERWTTGGEEVPVTVKVNIGGEMFETSVNFKVNAVKLSQVTAVSYTQRSDDAGKLFSTSDANDVLAAGDLTVSGVNNDGSAVVSAHILASMLKFNFENVQDTAEVTIEFEDGVTFAEGVSNKFAVQVSATQYANLSAEVKPGVIVFYNANEATIKHSIIVTVDYTNGDSKVLSDEEYTITDNNKDDSTYQRVIEISYNEGDTAGEPHKVELIISCAAPWSECEKVSVLYEQATELFAISDKAALLGGGNRLTVIAKYNFSGGESKEQKIYDYSILKSDGSAFDTLGQDGGTVTLTVRYEVAPETYKDATFTVDVTKKAVVGIQAEYVLNDDKTLYTSTSQAVLEAKGALTVEEVNNDGTIGNALPKLVDGVTTGYSYEINFANAGTGTIVVKYGDFTTTCEVKDIVAPSIKEVYYKWDKDNNVVYVGDDVSKVRQQLLVYGVYDDEYNGEKQTPDKQLPNAQYNLDVDTSKVSASGGVVFTIEYVYDATKTVTINDVIIKQLIKEDTATRFEYSKLTQDGANWTDWADVVDNKLVEKNKYQLRLVFTAADGNDSEMYIKVNGSAAWGDDVATWVNGGYTLTTGYSSEAGYVAENGLYVLDGGLKVKLTLEVRKVTGINVEYTRAEGATVYTTTNHEELVQNVAITEEQTITAKGSIAISLVYNDGSTEAVTPTYNSDGVTNGTYSLQGALRAGDNNITVLYLYENGGSTETLFGSFTVNAVTPEIDAESLQASVTGGSISIVYGDPDGETKIRNSLTVTGTYADDYKTSFDIDKSNITLSYAEGESETHDGTYADCVVGSYSIYVGATVGEVAVTAQKANGTLTVTQRTIQIVVTANGGTYRGAITAPTIYFANKLDKDTITPVVKYYANYADGDENDTTKGTTDVPTTAGTYKVVVTIPDTAVAANYVLGNAEATKFDFEISCKDISHESIEAKITSAAKDLVYTGNAITPTFTLTDKYGGENELVVDVDYNNVVYANNTYASTEESKATITVGGIGNYTGTRVIEFTIARTELKWTTAPIIENEAIYIGMPVTDIVLNKYEAAWGNIKAEGKISFAVENLPDVAGEYDLEYTFTPDYASYGPITDKFKVNVVPVTITIEEHYENGYILGGSWANDGKTNKTITEVVEYGLTTFDLTQYSITTHAGYEYVFRFNESDVTELKNIKASCTVYVLYKPLSENYKIRVIKMDESGKYLTKEQLEGLQLENIKKYWKEVEVSGKAKTGDTVNLSTINTMLTDSTVVPEGFVLADFVPSEGFEVEKYGVGYDGAALDNETGTQLNGTGTTVIYVFYLRHSHKITLVTYGGTVDKWVDYVRNIYYGGDIPAISAARKDGYTFKGWYTTSDFATENLKSEDSIAASTMGASNITYYAKWEKADSKLTLVDNPGIGNTNTPVINEDKYNIYTTALQGYTEDINEANAWSKTFTIDDAFALPTITSDGYTFDGWYTEAEGGVRVTSITTGTTAGIKLYARWTAKKFSVTYDANGGTFADNVNRVFTMTTGTAYPDLLSETVISRVGYRFGGWTTSKEGEVGIQAGETAYLTGSTWLYAIWTPIDYTMKLNESGLISGVSIELTAHGNVIENNVVHIGDIVSIVVKAPVGYDVGVLTVGANEQSVINGRTYTVRKSSVADGSSDILITPTLNLIIYSITYSYPGATTTTSWDSSSYPTEYTVAYVDEYRSLDLPGYDNSEVLSKAGYKFKGWLFEGKDVGYSFAFADRIGVDYRDLTFVADWTAEQQPITFDFNYPSVSSGDGPSVSYKYTTERLTGSTFYLANANSVTVDGKEIEINNLSGLYSDTSGGINRANFEFIGWATSPLGAVVYPATYEENNEESIMSISGSFTVKPGDNVFYAKWNVADVQRIIITAGNNECTYDGENEVVLTPTPRYKYESDSKLQLTYTWYKLVDGEWKPVDVNGKVVVEEVSVSFKADEQEANAAAIKLHLKEVSDSGQYKCTLSVKATDETQSGTEITHSYGEGEQQVIINKGTLTQIELKDKAEAYDGKAHTLQISHDATLTDEEFAKLLEDEGITVTYDASYIDVGTYTVKATFTVPEASNFMQIDPMTATLTITPKLLTDADIVWTSSVLNPDYVDGGEEPKYLFSKVYDGTPLTLGITIKGIEGDDITAVFDGTFESAVGTHTALIGELGGAQGGNYSIAGVTAEGIKHEYSITKAIIDISGITFEDADVTYDNSLHTLSVIGDLPDYIKDHVTIEYTKQYEPNVASVDTGDQTNASNGGVNAGVYRITASFIIDETLINNYEPIEDMIAVLTINKSDFAMNYGDFKDTSVGYDSESAGVKPTIADEHLGIFTATYTYEQLTNNSYVEIPNETGFKDSGSYRVTAKFAFKSNEDGSAVNPDDVNNYNLPEDKVITYVIQYPDVQSISVKYDPVKEYKVGDEFDRTELIVIATYVLGTNANTTVTLTSEEYTMHFYIYDEAHPEGYVGDEFVTFLKSGTINLVVRYDEKTSAPFEVNVGKGDIDVSGVTCTDVTVTYDGKYHLPEVANVPEELNVYFTLNGDDTNTKYYPAEELTAGAINAGEHTFTLHYELAEGYDADYNGVDTTATAKVTINQKALTISFAISQDGTTVNGTPEYNGKEYEVVVKAEGFIGDEGTSRKLDVAGNKMTDAGTYIVKVKNVVMSNDASVVDNNYVLTGELLYQWSIEQKEVSIELISKDYTYNGQVQSVDVTVGKLIDEDEVTAVVSYGGIEFKNVGEYNVRVTGLTGTAAGNYKLPTSGLTGQYAIAAQTVSAVWTVASSDGSEGDITLLQYRNQSMFDRITVNIKDSADNYITDNIGNPITLTLSSDKGSFTDVGDYVLTASYADTNYSILEETKTKSFRITASVSTVVWSYAIADQNGDYTEMEADSEGVYSLPYIGKSYYVKAEYELLGGAREEMTVSLGEVKNYQEGGYAITASTNTNLGKNYTLGNTDITLNINKVVVAINWPTDGYAFDGSEKSVADSTLTITDETVNGVTISGHITDQALEIAYSDDSTCSATNAGDYTVKFKLAVKGGATVELANFELAESSYKSYAEADEYPYTYIWTIASTKLKVKESSSLEIDRSGEVNLLMHVTEANTLAEIKAQFVGENLNLTVVNASGKALTDDSVVGTGTKIALMSGDKKIDEVTVIVKGDSSGDGKINIMDKTKLQRAISKLDTLSDIELMALDINGDGKINIMDKTKLQRHISKLENIFAANTPAPAN